MSDGCRLFAMTQYECSPAGGKVTCWPLERIFRQCANGPAIEVTNLLEPVSGGDGKVKVDPKYIENPPKAKNWNDLR
ncbi:hypothetical protein JCM24511_05579 [Saitozyma sp. JCM 24511]|nr:hypothetical protein JCM24511_05579 [Saitozyma sp. JCM 24511]